MSAFCRIRTLFLICLAAAVSAAAAGLALARTPPQAAFGSTLTAPRGSVLTDGVDLDVTYISRAPLYQSYCVDYPWNYPNMPGIPFLCPGTENEQRWPANGEIVTYTAHIVNKGSQASPSCDYAWLIDGSAVLSGTLPALAPGAQVTATYQWPWAHTVSPDGQRLLGEHTAGFFVDASQTVPETHESNNLLVDRTNAKSLRIVITPEMYAAYNVPVDPQYPSSAEDWLQKQIAAMNGAFAGSSYPTTPDGATDRVRINLIETGDEYSDDQRAHDGGWFVNADYRHGASGGYDPTLDVDWNLVHELGHQVALIDLYAIGAAAPSVLVTSRDGRPANFGFSWAHPDLMGGGSILPHTDPHLFSGHTAGGLSSNKGYRNGYYGAYLFDIPLQNYLLVLDNQGQPAAGVTVAVYQRQGPWDWSGNTGIDATPEISGTTGADGRFLLTNRSADGGTTTRTGHVLHDNPFGVIDILGTQDMFLVQLRRGDHEEFFWLDITAFNLAYWSGDVASHTFTIASHVPPAGAPSAPRIAALRPQGEQVEVCWTAGPAGTVTYHVYRAGPPQFEYELAATLTATGTCVNDEYTQWGYDGHVYAVTAVDGTGRESGFGSTGWIPHLVAPAAVLVVPGSAQHALGDVLHLDPQNGYAVARMEPDGQYRQHVGSVHFHLELSRFFTRDANGLLIFSHPGDYYSPRQSVRIADEALAPLLEFGRAGAGAGQFQTPAGVAAWGPACTLAGPYADDPRALLLVHFDGSTTGTQGEIGAATGTAFAAGRYGQGILVDASDTLTYTTAGNIERTQGGIEFWIRPNWDGDDGQSYTFFETGDEWSNRMRISKDGANNLRWLMWDSSQEYGVAYSIAAWRAGEWHHIAAAWRDGDMLLFVDGRPAGSTGDTRPPDVLDDVMYIGSSALGAEQANAMIDELRISDLPRVGDSDACTRILVADSGNNRVQAFDAVGNFLTAFGTYGSGNGQFDSPQGLAVDGQGRVIVADRGNNRLQILSFDGQVFTHQITLAAGLNTPTGVTVDGAGRLIVADTGNHRIAVLAAGGSLLAEYFAPNDGYSGSFLSPEGVAVNGDGTIFVADTGNRRVVRIVPRGPGTICLPLVLLIPP